MTKQELDKIIGENIKYYRLLYSLTKEKLTQKKLAKLVDVSTNLIGSLESKKIDAGTSIFTLYKISKVLGVSMDRLCQKR